MIFIQLQEQLQQLSATLSQIDDQPYCTPVKHLSGATIGQHTRHIIELLNCALEGKKTGTIDYINRLRDLTLESDRKKAMAVLNELITMVDGDDETLYFNAGSTSAANKTIVTTTFYREIVYNTEHTTHHLALIKVALIELNLFVFNENFGVADSTIQYKASLALQA